MATDRYSDDHKILVGRGNGELTIDAKKVIFDTEESQFNMDSLVIDGDSVSIDLDSDLTVTSSNLTVTSSNDVNISASNVNITSENTNIDSDYIDIKSAVIKADSTILVEDAIEKKTPKSRTVFIPGEVFVPDTMIGGLAFYSYGGGSILTASSGTVRYHLPFIIPNDSTIDSINMYCLINSEFDEAKLYLQRTTLFGMGSSSDEMAVLTSSNDSLVLGTIQVVTESTISNSTISYDTAAYYLRLHISASSTVEFYGVTIDYSTANIAG